MKAKEFIPQSKPRNFVAKNQKTVGAGAHKDKKRAEKQGDVKHKSKVFDEEAAGVGIVTKQNATVDVPVGGEYMNVKKLFPKKKKVKEQSVAEDSLNELSSELLGRYKKGASASATAADKAGDYAKGNKRFSGIVKATKKQFSNDSKDNK